MMLPSDIFSKSVKKNLAYYDMSCIAPDYTLIMIMTFQIKTHTVPYPFAIVYLNAEHWKLL